ncbi:MAG: HlyD family efflux transporter periplasmic adaptor subunit [Desulfitobacteriaceae bacterium]
MRGVNRHSRGLLWGLVVIVILSGGGLWFYRSIVTNKELTFDYAQAGVIKHGIKVKATFVNQEFVIHTTVAGKVQFLGVDGQRFRRGETVANVQPEGTAPGTKTGNQGTIALAAPNGGLFFHKIDGCETFLTTENLRSTNLAELLSQKATVQTTDSVQAGGVIGKIVNNLVPTEAFIELPSLNNIMIGKSIRLTIADQVQVAKVILKSERPLGTVVQFNQFVDKSVENRQQEIIWEAQPSVSGIIIPKSSLWTQGEEQGVYVIFEGVIHYRKVKILDENETRVCVQDLPSGMPIVIIPRNGIEGMLASAKKP